MNKTKASEYFKKIKLLQSDVNQDSDEELEISNIEDEVYLQDHESKELKDDITLVDSKIMDLDSVIGEFLKNILDSPEFDEYIKTIEVNNESLNKFLSPGKSVRSDDESELIVLRQWNSFTPILPDADVENKGGGYFVIHEGKGLVIDPGYNFIEHFFQAGFKIDDIDYVFVTHAHDDHTGQLEGILSMLFKRNKKFWEENELDKIHKVKLFLNVGTFTKFSHILGLNNEVSDIEQVVVLNECQKYEVIDEAGVIIELFTTKTKHKEVITNSYALGFTFRLTNSKGEECVLRFTGDTGWNSEIEKLNKLFFSKNGIDEVDVLVLHLGSIQKSELSYDFSNSFKDNANVLYKYHLGLIGSIAMIYEQKAKLSIMSEFGLELGDMRIKICELISKELKDLPVVPADVNLRVRLFQTKIRCSYTKNYYLPSDVSVHQKNNGKLVYLDNTVVPHLPIQVPKFVEEKVSVF